MESITPVTFSKDELWMLQRVVRHEVSPPWQGKWPTYSQDLNDQVAAAIVLCEDQAQSEAALQLSKGDLYLIDALVPVDAKTAAGTPIGKNILLKTFRARDAFSSLEIPLGSISEPAVPDFEEKLGEWKNKRHRPRKRSS